jgi:hypothetical protein
VEILSIRSLKLVQLQDAILTVQRAQMPYQLDKVIGAYGTGDQSQVKSGYSQAQCNWQNPTTSRYLNQGQAPIFAAGSATKPHVHDEGLANLVPWWLLVTEPREE